VEGMYDFAMKKYLSIDPREHPIMIGEANFNTMDRREKLVELIFERFDYPALFLCKNAVLASFSVGRSTSLVIDSGAGVTSIVPVHEGYVLHKGLKKSVVAGNMVDQWLLNELFISKARPIIPRYKIKKEIVGPSEFKITEMDLPNATASYHRYMTMELIRDIKESLCRVSETTFDVSANANIPYLQYELPDGKIIDVGIERFTMPERLFDQVQVKDDLDPSFVFKGIPRMIQSSVDACDVDIRKELYQGMVLTGGNSLFPGFAARLQKDIGKLMPPAFKSKVIQAPTKTERKYGVWIGGSILASLGSFHQMWFSKADYEEHGVSVLQRKCP